MRNFVTFETAFEDDAIWDSRENIISPAGRNVAAAIAAQLSMMGCACSEPTQHSFYGWSFNVTRDRERFWLLLQGRDPWLLICEPRRTILQRMFRVRDDDTFDSLLLTLYAALKADDRITHLRWYSREDYETNRSDVASESPV